MTISYEILNTIDTIENLLFLESKFLVPFFEIQRNQTKEYPININLIFNTNALTIQQYTNYIFYNTLINP